MQRGIFKTGAPPIRPGEMEPFDSSPLPWSDFFATRDMVEIGNDKFMVYKTEESSGPILFCLHGGGMAGLSFAALAPHVKEVCQVVSYDCRGHGDSQTEDDSDLSIERLVEDCGKVATAVTGDKDVIVIGHSMGGAVAVRAANQGVIRGLKGLFVIDDSNYLFHAVITMSPHVLMVVEGTALSALPHMPYFLSQRPQKFRTVEMAIEYAVKSNTIRNAQSARVSIPPTIRPLPKGQESPSPKRPAFMSPIEAPKEINTVAEEEEEGTGSLDLPPSPDSISSEKTPSPLAMKRPPPSAMKPPAPRSSSSLPPSPSANRPGLNLSQRLMQRSSRSKKSQGNMLTWRTDLGASQPFWNGWYKGLSQDFLDTSVPKVLVLAGTDRLDKDLTIAQMMGKFQTCVVYNAGHAIHEDNPETTAEHIVFFITRHKL